MTECGLLDAAKFAEELHHINGSWSCIVATGFGHCGSLDRAREVHRRYIERERAHGPLDPGVEVLWAVPDSQVGLRSTVQKLFKAMGHDYGRWRNEKATQQRLSFLEDDVL